jgi:hypothetical protein
MGVLKKNLSPKAAGPSAVRDVRVRSLGEPTKIQLFVRAGGRCEFAGCNEYLLEHHLTLTAGNFAQAAHIVAFSPRGPRADARLPARYVNDLSNLMLLCQRCHKLIDDNPGTYTVERLRHDKARHEERIHHVTGISADLKTTVVQVKARIAGRTVSVPFADVAKAVEPRYPADKKGVVIDLTSITASSADLLGVAKAEITAQIASLFTRALDRAETQHVSLFALGPIPLLVHLGRELSDKVEIDLYQRHRDTEDWGWKSAGTPAEYVLNTVRQGEDPKSAALCLSLSGSVHLGSLPPAIDGRFTVYDLTLASLAPSPLFLNTRGDLTRFRLAYQNALRTIGRNHPGLRDLHLFPAVPAPIAVLCGRELLPKVDPALLVYDADKTNGGFTLALTVNPS